MSLTGSAVFGTDLTGILNYWADIGVFSYVLPFLLVFAVVYGILSKIQIFGDPKANKGIYAVIGIVVGLLALQWDVMPEFFGTIFPYAGVGIGILLVVLILLGLFTDWRLDKDHWTRKALYFVGAIIAVIVIITALTDMGKWSGGVWWEQYGPALVTLAVIGTLVGIVIGGAGKKKDEPPSNPPPNR